MAQREITECIDSVGDKSLNHKTKLRRLPEWLEESRPSDYREREQTHQAWLEITDTILSWLWGLKQEQKTVSERKFKNKKRQALKEVVESGEYPYANLPDPEPQE